MPGFCLLVIIQDLPFNYIDVILVGVLVWALLDGYNKGLLNKLIDFGSMFVGFMVAVRLMSDVAAWARMAGITSAVLATLVAFFAVLSLTSAVVNLIWKQVILKLTEIKVILEWADKLFGSLLGFLKGAFLLSIILLFLSMVPFSEYFIPGQTESQLFDPVRNFGPQVYDRVVKVIPRSKNFVSELEESFSEVTVVGEDRHLKTVLNLLSSKHL